VRRSRSERRAWLQYSVHAALVDLGNPEARAAFVKLWGANVRPAITSEIIFTEMSVP